MMSKQGQKKSRTSSISVGNYKRFRASLATITIFGASGTAGDGILKAALANPDVRKIRVIAYRPDYIGQTLLYSFFSPVGAALKATQIGQAMMEVTARGDEFANGDKLSTLRIIRYSDAYEQ